MALTRTRNPLLAVAVALAVTAAGFAGWSGWSWRAAARDDSLAFAEERDEALSAGEQGALNFTTLDHRDLDAGLDTWEESATGDLLKQFRKSRDTFEKKVREAKSVTKGEVLESALTELDERAGKARLMVAMRVTVDTAEKKPVVKKQRLLGELTRTDEGWKLSALQDAPKAEMALTGDEQSSGGED